MPKEPLLGYRLMGASWVFGLSVTSLSARVLPAQARIKTPPTILTVGPLLLCMVLSRGMTPLHSPSPSPSRAGALPLADLLP